MGKVIVHVPRREVVSAIDRSLDGEGGRDGEERETLLALLDERDHLLGQVGELQARLSAPRYGRLARQEGHPLATNPHHPYTARGLHDGWADGWTRADLEHQRAPAACEAMAVPATSPTVVHLRNRTSRPGAPLCDESATGDTTKDPTVVTCPRCRAYLSTAPEPTTIAEGRSLGEAVNLAVAEGIAASEAGEHARFQNAYDHLRAWCETHGISEARRELAIAQLGERVGLGTGLGREAMATFVLATATRATPNPLFGPPPPAAPTWTAAAPAVSVGPAVGLSVLVGTPRGQILLGREGYGTSGTWGPPVGQLRAGETPAVAATRILHEESGLRVMEGRETVRVLPWVTFDAHEGTPTVMLWALVDLRHQPHPSSAGAVWVLTDTRPAPLSSSMEALLALGVDPFQPEALIKLADALLAQKHTIDSMVRDLSGVIPFARSNFPDDGAPTDSSATFLLNLLRALKAWRVQTGAWTPGQFFERFAPSPQMRDAIRHAEHVVVEEKPAGTFTVNPTKTSLMTLPMMMSETMGTGLSYLDGSGPWGRPNGRQAQWIAIFRAGCKVRGWEDPFTLLEQLARG